MVVCALKPEAVGMDGNKIDVSTFYHQRNMCTNRVRYIFFPHCKKDRLDDALTSAHLMQNQRFCISKNDAYCLLQESIKRKEIGYGRRVQFLMGQNGLDSLPLLADQLIRMFASCENVHEANNAFKNVFAPSIYTWTAIISANASIGQGMTALVLYYMMQLSGANNDKYVYLAVIKACTTSTTLAHGRLVHAQILEIVLETDPVIESALINMYVKSESLTEASRAFNKLSCPSLQSWSAMIVGHAQHGDGLLALESFSKMQQDGIMPSIGIALTILKVCANIGAIDQGRKVHWQLITDGLEVDLLVGTSLVDMYAKCEALIEASNAFTALQTKDMVSWSAMLVGHAEHGEGRSALEVFVKMKEINLKPDNVTFLSIFKVCAGIREIMEGRLIHSESIRIGLEHDIAVGTTLIDMYMKCGSIQEASTVFSKPLSWDIVSWSATIGGYAEHGEVSLALECFGKMQQEGIRPNKVTFLSVLKACTNGGALLQGRVVHESIFGYELASDIVILNTLIDMYGKCGSLEEADKVFNSPIKWDDVSWSAMIAAHALHGNLSSTMELYERMQGNGIQPGKVIFLSVLKTCGNTGATEHGRIFHEQIIVSGLSLDSSVGNSLVDMYSRIGCIEEAFNVFENLHCRDVVSWDALIAGFVLYGDGFSALENFERMQQEGIRPERATFLNVLKACGNIGAINYGRILHQNLNRIELALNISVGTTIVDMYAKCGSLKEAEKLFEILQTRDVISWNTIMASYAYNGATEMITVSLEEMQQEGIKPNDITFASILAACGRTGLVDEGFRFFNIMREEHGIIPGICHNNCMVDLLGRAGCWQEIEKLFLSPYQLSMIGWTSLLNSCRMHGNVELGIRCFDEVLFEDPCNDAAFVLMASIYER